MIAIIRPKLGSYLPFEPNSSSPSMAPSEGSSTGAPSEIFCRLSTGDLRRLNDEIFSLRTGVQDLIIQRELAVQRTRVSARWELMKEWLENKVGHWNPEEEYRQYLFVIGEGGQFGGFPLVSPPAPADASSS